MMMSENICHVYLAVMFLHGRRSGCLWCTEKHFRINNAQNISEGAVGMVEMAYASL